MKLSAEKNSGRWIGRSDSPGQVSDVFVGTDFGPLIGGIVGAAVAGLASASIAITGRRNARRTEQVRWRRDRLSERSARFVEASETFAITTVDLVNAINAGLAEAKDDDPLVVHARLQLVEVRKARSALLVMVDAAAASSSWEALQQCTTLLTVAMAGDRETRRVAEQHYSAALARFLVDIRRLLDIADLPPGVAQIEPPI